MGDKSQEYQLPQCQILAMETCRTQLQCVLYIPVHKCCITQESKGELFVHDEVPLPEKTKLLLFKVLKIFFFRHFNWFYFAGF